MNPKTSTDLFNKIRSQFSNIEVGDESGLPTADPATAVFFEFDFGEADPRRGACGDRVMNGDRWKFVRIVAGVKLLLSSLFLPALSL